MYRDLNDNLLFVANVRVSRLNDNGTVNRKSRVAVEIGLNLSDALRVYNGDWEPILWYLHRYAPGVFVELVWFEEGDNLFLAKEQATRNYADWIEDQATTLKMD